MNFKKERLEAERILAMFDIKHNRRFGTEGRSFPVSMYNSQISKAARLHVEGIMDAFRAPFANYSFEGVSYVDEPLKLISSQIVYWGKVKEELRNIQREKNARIKESRDARRES